jgi:hypothetical protein
MWVDLARELLLLLLLSMRDLCSIKLYALQTHLAIPFRHRTSICLFSKKTIIITEMPNKNYWLSLQSTLKTANSSAQGAFRFLEEFQVNNCLNDSQK